MQPINNGGNSRLDEFDFSGVSLDDTGVDTSGVSLGIDHNDDYVGTPVPPKQDFLLPQTARNVLAGATTGMKTENFSGSLANIVEARLPIGRLFTEDEQGNTQFWQSTPDWLGISDEEWDSMEYADRQVAISNKTKADTKEYFDAEDDSVSYMIGNLVGMLADPTTAIPVAAGATTAARVGYGAAVGATDVATYQYGNEGEVNPTTVLLGTALGAGAARVFGGAAPKVQEAQLAQKVMDDFQETFPRFRSFEPDYMKAYNETLKVLGINSDILDKASHIVGRVPKLVSQKTAREILESGATGVAKRTGGWKGLDHFIEPISRRIHAMSPRIHYKLNKSFRKTMELAHVSAHKSEPFLSKLSKLSETNPEAFRAINKAMMFEGKKVPELVSVHMGESAVRDLALYRKGLDEMADEAERIYGKYDPKTGQGFKRLDDYFPRWVKDYNALKNSLGKEDKAYIQKLLDAQADKLKRELTEEEVAGVYNKYLGGIYDPKNVRSDPGAIKKRTIRDLDDDAIAKAYADPVLANHNYIRSMTTDMYRAEMMGKHFVQDNLTESIGNFASKYVKDPDDLKELQNLLNLIYVDGRKKPGEFVRRFKNLGYAATIGNPLSALTQIGDIAIGTAIYGARDAMNGISKAITGKGFSPRDFGLMDNVIEELATDPSFTKKILDTSLNFGFRQIDGIGKASVMNASLSQILRRVKTAKGLAKLNDKWRPALGKDLDDVIRLARLPEKEFRDIMRKSNTAGQVAGEVLEPWQAKAMGDLKAMVFSDLADIQPITLMEQAKGYLQNPNGRLMYMLKTFSMKYLNLLRTGVIDNLKAGRKKEAIYMGTTLVGMFTLAGVGTDSMKDFVLQRDRSIDDKLINNFMKNTQLLDNYRYTELTKTNSPTESLIMALAPPLSIVDPATRAVIRAAQGEFEREDAYDMVKMLPVVGGLFHNYLFGGLEEYRWKH